MPFNWREDKSLASVATRWWNRKQQSQGYWRGQLGLCRKTRNERERERRMERDLPKLSFPSSTVAFILRATFATASAIFLLCVPMRGHERWIHSHFTWDVSNKNYSDEGWYCVITNVSSFEQYKNGSYFESILSQFCACEVFKCLYTSSKMNCTFI